MTRNAYRTCQVCSHYLTRRAAALDDPIAYRAFVRGVTFGVVLHEYLTAVHDRHLAGQSLSTRPWTPDHVDQDGTTHLTVKRACNGCGDTLGDATTAELEDAVAGDQLTDVTLECGCAGRAVLPPCQDVSVAGARMVAPEEIHDAMAFPSSYPVRPGALR